MARHADGWKLRWNRGVAHVRFTHAGHRYDVSTRESDQGRARVIAAQIYAQTISGRRRVGGWSSTAPLADILGTWLDAYEAGHDPDWSKEVMIVARSQWLTRWDRLVEITNASTADYVRARLREVSRDSILKEISSLRQFLAWALEQKLISVAIVVETPPRRALGKVRPKKIRDVLTEARAMEIIASLPEFARRAYRGSKPHRVRDFFIVLWETGLRPTTVARLQPSHWDGNALHIPASLDKGRYHRTLPVTERARGALDRALPFGRHDFRSYLPRGVTPYDFRHGRITALVEAGGPLPGVQFLAGHKSLSTTAKYVHASERAAREALQALDSGAKVVPKRHRKSAQGRI